jgi:hypothetical protein
MRNANPVYAGTALAPIEPRTATLAALVLLATLASCAQMPAIAPKQAAAPAPSPAASPELPMEPQEPEPEPKTLWEWDGDGRSVSHIWIDVESQRARFYDGSEQIGWTFVASGLKSHPTPVGRFAVMEKTSKKRSNLYGKIYNSSGRVVNSDAKRGRDPIPAGGRFEGAKMPYFMRLTYDGVGLHAGRIPVPGFPASHGCIRMPREVAPLLYKHVSLGTPVTISGDGPDYGNYAERQRLARAEAARARETADSTPQANPGLSRPAQPVEPAAEAGPATSAGMEESPASSTSSEPAAPTAPAENGVPGGTAAPAETAPPAAPAA